MGVGERIVVSLIVALLPQKTAEVMLGWSVIETTRTFPE